MRFACILLFLIPVRLISQSFNDLPGRRPEPYTLTPHFDKINNTGLKKACMIYKENSGQTDTISAEYYNKAGQKYRSVRYEKGKPNSESVYTYNKNNYETETEGLSYNSPENRTKTLYYYDSAGRPFVLTGVTLYNKDTAHTDKATYFYKDNKLVTRQIFSHKSYFRLITYHYTGNRLDSIHTINPYLIPDLTDLYINRHPAYINGTYDTVPYKVSFLDNYFHDSAGNLIKVESFNIRGHIRDTTGHVVYTYDTQGRVIADSTLTSSNISGRFYNCGYYSYDTAGRLIKMKATCKDKFRNVEFTYDGDRITNIKAVSNTTNNAYLIFWIPYGIRAVDGEEYEFEEQRFYDEYGNIILKKQLLNGELYKEILFRIEYY
ncbi:MAG: hypothetical protein ACO1PI_06635 [Bacteroidota bacterium]